MSGSAVFDDPDEGVMELVLSSDAEYSGDAPSAEEVRADRAARRQALSARFLPGVDAGALFAMVFALLGLTSSGLVDTLALNRQIVFQVSGAASLQQSSDPYTIYRSLTDIKVGGGGAFAILACVVAVLILLRWQEGTHARWSRPVAQTALGLGLLGLIFAILLFTGVVGGFPAAPHNPFFDNSTS